MGRGQKGFSVVIVIIIVLAVVMVTAAGFIVWKQGGQMDSAQKTNTQETAQPATDSGEPASFSKPKKGAHFETSTPAHESTLAAVPVEVVIDFNFDLADNSTIQINKDGKDYGTGPTRVDENKLAMRRAMDKAAPDGLYTVNYNGCWPDQTCHDGHFQFVIDKGQLSSYQDLRGQKAVTVKLSDIKFSPKNIRVASGTTITWVNDDSVDHYVNTDSHPAHTQVPGLNSRALKKGDSFSYTVSGIGAYPYHCSAHAAQMTGNIVAEET